jgi:dipeptidyl aminopeptidase/acylaminoacyl peptidase
MHETLEGRDASQPYIQNESENTVPRRSWRDSLVAGALLALVLMLALPVMSFAAGSSTLAVVRSSGADLYDAPDGAAIQSLARGSALEAIGRTADGAWLKVTTADGKTGWTPAARLVVFAVENLPALSDAQAKPAQSSAAPGSKAITSTTAITGTVTTVGELLNLRAGPGTDYAVIGTRSPGETLALAGRDKSADWLAVALPDGKDIGWVSSSFVRAAGDPARLPITDRVSVAPSATTSVAAQRQTPAATGLTGKLVFQAASGQIQVYDLASGNVQSLTTGSDPALSPDGQTVAFWRQDGGEHGLYVIDVNGGKERRVLARSEKLRTPAWSPDGRAIAFSHVNGEETCRDAGYGVCLPDVFPYSRMFPAIRTDRWALAAIDREGGNYRDVPGMSGATSPDWGTRGLMYAAGGIQSTQDNGKADSNVALLKEARFRDPVWQPGGDRIAFQSLEKDHWEIFIANNDGGNPTALTRPATTLVPKLPQNVSPTWSPDGRSIAYLSDRSGKWAIWVMDANGANQRMLPVDVPVEYRNQGEQMLSWGK